MVLAERLAAFGITLGRSNVALRSVDDGHQLTNSLDVLWLETAKALGLKT